MLSWLIREVFPVLNNEDEIICAGVSDDFAWYELDMLQKELYGMRARMARLSAVLSTRYKEQSDYVVHLKRTIDRLHVENAALKAAAKEK